jgi:hypothetical protein
MPMPKVAVRRSIRFDPAVVRRVLMFSRRWRWRLFMRPRSRTVEAIKVHKTTQRQSDYSYAERPTVSIIVQSFNQVQNIATLEQRLRATCADELIVCEDGSIDGSHEEWLRRLVRPNDFLLHSNDIHEIRSYGRAVGYSRGQVICLLQDDDRPPRDGLWLSRALELFSRHPRLAVLGGWCGFDEYFETEYNAPWLPAGVGTIPSTDPQSGMPFVFVESVNIGPYLFRKQVFDRLGGFDLRFSPPGEPGITFESEFCYRVWRHGHQVALTHIPVKVETGGEGYVFPGGTTLWGNEERVRNEQTNKRLIQELYEADIFRIRRAVQQANAGLLAAQPQTERNYPR